MDNAGCTEWAYWHVSTRVVPQNRDVDLRMLTTSWNTQWKFTQVVRKQKFSLGESWKSLAAVDCMCQACSLSCREGFLIRHRFFKFINLLRSWPKAMINTLLKLFFLVLTETTHSFKTVWSTSFVGGIFKQKSIADFLTWQSCRHISGLDLKAPTPPRKSFQY